MGIAYCSGENMRIVEACDVQAPIIIRRKAMQTKTYAFTVKWASSRSARRRLSRWYAVNHERRRERIEKERLVVV